MIKSNWVITAAHCVNGKLNPSAYEVDIGFNHRSKPDSWSVSKKVLKIVMHPHYDLNLLDENDIALLKLQINDETNNRFNP